MWVALEVAELRLVATIGELTLVLALDYGAFILVESDENYDSSCLIAHWGLKIFNLELYLHHFHTTSIPWLL